MGKKRIATSQQERERLKVLQEVQQGYLKQAVAAERHPRILSLSVLRSRQPDPLDSRRRDVPT